MLTKECQQFHKEWAKKELNRLPQYQMLTEEQKERNKKRRRCRGYDKYRMRKLRKDPQFRLYDNISVAIRIAMKGNKQGRGWETLVGYTVKDLMEHLEKLFDENMTWENYGLYWQIDHCIPSSWFDKSKIEKAWTLNNLQPLEAKANLSKGNRYATPL